MLQKFSNKVWLAFLITALSRVFTCEDIYSEIYNGLSARGGNAKIFNYALDNHEIFNKRGASTNQSLARYYVTSRFMELSRMELDAVVVEKKDLFNKTLFGKSLILGWALHNDGYDLGELFRIKADVKYGNFYKDALSNVGITTTNAVIEGLNALDRKEHADFYFETVHLAWPSKELRCTQPLESKEIVARRKLLRYLKENEKRIKAMEATVTEVSAILQKSQEPMKFFKTNKEKQLLLPADEEYNKALNNYSKHLSDTAFAKDIANQTLEPMNMMVTWRGKRELITFLNTIEVKKLSSVITAIMNELQTNNFSAEIDNNSITKLTYNPGDIQKIMFIRQIFQENKRLFD